MLINYYFAFPLALLLSITFIQLIISAEYTRT